MRALETAVVVAVAIFFSSACDAGSRGKSAPDLVGTWELEPETIGPRARGGLHFEMKLDANGGATTTLVQRVPPSARTHAGCTITRIDAASSWDADDAELSFDSAAKIVYTRAGCADPSDDVGPDVRDALEADVDFPYEVEQDGDVLVLHHDVGRTTVDQRYVRVSHEGRPSAN